MSTDHFSELEDLARSKGVEATLDKLAETLQAEKQYHHLFDARLMQKKHAMGLPLSKPTSFDDVPEAKKEEFEQAYIAAARDVGNMLLADKQLGQAWMYFRTIRETAPIRSAVEALDPRFDASDEIIELALYHGLAPAKGVQMLLQTHGTCSTITALDQQFMRLDSPARSETAAVMVERLYEDLTQSIQMEVERKQGLPQPGLSLRELIAGRDWLFADGNYHIDVSHLHSVIRFSRSITAGHPALDKAIQLAEYGAQLSPQYQYAGEPPFEEFYPAHIHFLGVLADRNREEGLKFFRARLPEDPHASDAQLMGLVYVDLLLRLDRTDEAVAVAAKYLSQANEELGFSFAELCRETGRYDLLQQTAKDRGDLLTFTSALLSATPG